MTIASQTTRQGRVIHLLSPGDLGDAVRVGEVEVGCGACCPSSRGGDPSTLPFDLIPRPVAGFCHLCHATVLVTPTGSVSSADGV